MQSLLGFAAGLALLSGCGESSFRPSTGPSSQTTVLLGAGDIGECETVCSELTAQASIAAWGMVFTAGDNAYPHGSDTNYATCYLPTWGRHRDRTRPRPGNHDYETAGAQGYFNYFRDRAGPAGLGYYSYRLGAQQTFALNSEIAAERGSAQHAWLVGELSRRSSRCTLAYWHRPLFSSGPNGDNPQVRDLWRALQDFDADVIVTGHEHSYERVAPQDADGRADPVRGIRQFVVGTGGGHLTRHVSVRANSEVRGSEWGVLRLALSEESYHWEFLPVDDGTLRDSGSSSCH